MDQDEVARVLDTLAALGEHELALAGLYAAAAPCGATTSPCGPTSPLRSEGTPPASP